MIHDVGTSYEGLGKTSLSCLLLQQVSTVSSLVFHSSNTNRLLYVAVTGVITPE